MIFYFGGTRTSLLFTAPSRIGWNVNIFHIQDRVNDIRTGPGMDL